MKILTLGLFLLLQVQNCINIKNIQVPPYDNTFLVNKSLPNSYLSSKQSSVTYIENSQIKQTRNAPTYVTYKNNIPIAKVNKRIQVSPNEVSINKFKKSINEVTTLATESIDEVDEEIESFTIYNDGDIDNTTMQGSSTPENVTDFSEMTTEDVTESLNTTVTTLNTTLDVTTLPPKTKKSKSKKKSSSKSKNKTCDCDLTKFLCDVNCCCDKDCLETDKAVFSECIDSERTQNNYWNSRYCTSKQFVFKNNSPWLIENHSNDLFCVMKDNLPPKLKGKAPKIITSNEEINNISTHFYSWPEEKRNQINSFDNSKPYVVNDDIWILVNTTLRVLDVPTSSLTQYCNSRTSLKYLMNFQSKCLSALPNVDMYDMYNQSNALFLISNPIALNETWIKSPKECPANVCIPILVIVCDTQNCSLLNSTEDRPLPNCQENYCTNMITSVRYDFYTNGSTGYTNASIYFGLSDMFLTSKYIQQDFQITQAFINRNTSEISHPLSGNPGYISGKPIIISKMIAYKESNDSEETEMLEYFSTRSLYPLRNILSVPKNVKGFCVLSNISFEEIRFRENIQFTCQSVHNITKHIAKDNATAACTNIQHDLIKFMSYNFITEHPKLFVSTTGNPVPDAKTWIEMLHETSPDIISGTFDEDQTSLSCFNVKSKVKFTFVYAADVYPDTGSQMSLVGAGVSYTAQDHNVYLIKDNLVVTTLSVNTRFVDVTKPQSPIYARGPSFHINLPADFFYPFSLNNASSLGFDKIYFALCLLFISLKY